MTAPSPLDLHIGYWLRLVSNQVSQAFATALSAREVSVAEWVVLRQLFETPALAPSVLAQRMGMTRGAITKLADRLIARDLVVRVASATDGRAQSLSLSPAGHALVPDLAELADANDAAFFDHLPAGEREALATTLRRLAGRYAIQTIPID